MTFVGEKPICWDFMAVQTNLSARLLNDSFKLETYLQTASTSLGGFFSSMELTISSSKSEVMMFSRKHERPPIVIRIRSHVLPQSTTFKYLGYFSIVD
jgi:hypothetical protein